MGKSWELSAELWKQKELREELDLLRLEELIGGEEVERWVEAGEYFIDGKI